MVTSMNGPAPETPGPAHRHAGGAGRSTAPERAVTSWPPRSSLRRIRTARCPSWASLW